MLLLHVPGATSFRDLKTIGGQEMDTFKQACVRLRLVENDNALQEALTEAAAHMPRQLPTMFAKMCVFNQPVNALQLWNENKHFMIEDLLLRHDNITAENVALHLLNALFMENGMTCNMVSLPEPVGDHATNEDVGNNNIDVSSLNVEQREIFNAVVERAFSVERGELTENRLFYVDAPGGSGKTHLFNKGLCNGTRLQVIQLHEHSIEASIISDSHAHNRVLIPRIKLNPSDANIPFVLRRTQFPVRLFYSMTINKAQGQTFDRVGMYLPKPCFTYGQLYVAFSRAKAMNNVRGNVHLGNVVVVEGVCRLMGAENLVLGLPHPLRNLFTHVRSLNSIQAIDVYCFGHLLYELVMRRQLTTPTCDTLPVECPPLCRKSMSCLLSALLSAVSASCRKTAGSKTGHEHELFLVVSSRRELARIGSVLESIFSPEAAKNGMPTIEGLLTHPFFNEIPLHSHGRASLHLPPNVKQALLTTHQNSLSRLLADQKKVRLQKRIQKAEALLAQQSYKLTHRNKEAKKTGTKSAGATPPSSTITSPGTSSQGASQDNLSQPRHLSNKSTGTRPPTKPHAVIECKNAYGERVMSLLGIVYGRILPVVWFDGPVNCDVSLEKVQKNIVFDAVQTVATKRSIFTDAGASACTTTQSCAPPPPPPILPHHSHHDSISATNHTPPTLPTSCNGNTAAHLAPPPPLPPPMPPIFQSDTGSDGRSSLLSSISSFNKAHLRRADTLERSRPVM
ncbi:P-loop containing nucleoside triphosphate hydrolase [Trinorchestia longiramus]|nr:P-loop containing nucleoside triphosphate hydrolase [Trinorchestia longiramus]